MWKGKIVFRIMALLLVGMLALTFNIPQAESLEPPLTEWTRTYGGAGWDRALSVVQTFDGGYALGGFTNSFGAGSYDFWLVKTDSSGNMEWNQTYGGASDDFTEWMAQTSDEGYALTGYTKSFGAGDWDAWLIKTDAVGNMEWNQTYGGASRDAGSCPVQTSDGGYALAGYTRSFGAGGFDLWLVKTDSSGNMEWNQTYGGTSDDEGWWLIQTSDGGYALTGETASFGAGGFDFWLIKLGAVTATVDIDPDTLALKSKGKWITVYIQLPEGYDPEDIDATTILLNGTIKPVLDPKYGFVTNPSEYLVDHNEDGILEYMVKFNTAEVKALLSAGEATLTITGEVNGIPFKGSATIKVIDE